MRNALIQFLVRKVYCVYDCYKICVISGRRSCAGETLAKLQIFLTTANLLQRFNITRPLGAEPLSTEPAALSVVLSPQDYKVFMIARK